MLHNPLQSGYWVKAWALRCELERSAHQKETATGMWRNLVTLSLSVFLLGAALMANVGDGPMSQYRGSWLTRASR